VTKSNVCDGHLVENAFIAVSISADILQYASSPTSHDVMTGGHGVMQFIDFIAWGAVV